MLNLFWGVWRLLPISESVETLRLTRRTENWRFVISTKGEILDSLHIMRFKISPKSR